VTALTLNMQEHLVLGNLLEQITLNSVFK